jgi:hypothetical protein
MASYNGTRIHHNFFQNGRTSRPPHTPNATHFAPNLTNLPRPENPNINSTRDVPSCNECGARYADCLRHLEAVVAKQQEPGNSEQRMFELSDEDDGEEFKALLKARRARKAEREHAKQTETIKKEPEDAINTTERLGAEHKDVEQPDLSGEDDVKMP